MTNINAMQTLLEINMKNIDGIYKVDILGPF
ncbi:MAG: hypothetical protein ACI845_004097, partial [Gammaproteobacteria bacterium]